MVYIIASMFLRRQSHVTATLFKWWEPHSACGFLSCFIQIKPVAQGVGVLNEFWLGKALFFSGKHDDL